MSDSSRFWHEQMVFSHQAQELFESVQRGDLHRVQELLERGTNPNVCDVRGLRPLQVAVSLGYAQVAAALLHSGAEVNAYNRVLDGALPPLHLAVAGRQFSIARMLLSAQANAQLVERRSGDTALHRGAAAGELDFCRLVLSFCTEGTKKYLLDRGNRMGLSPLHSAAHSGQAVVCRELVSTAADPGARDNRGWTPLLHAAARGHSDVLDFLLSTEAQCLFPQREEVTLSDLCTALHLSSANGHLSAVRLLLHATADVHGTDKEGQSALHKACAAPHVEVAQVLLCANADPSRRDSYGSSAVSLALEAGLTGLVQTLMRFGGQSDPVASAFVGGRRRYVPPCSEFRTNKMREMRGGDPTAGAVKQMRGAWWLNG